MMHVLQSEIFRLRKRPQAWILILIMVVGAGAFYVAAAIAASVISDPDGAKESLQLPNIYENGMFIVAFAGFILSVVVASGLIGNEFSWNTIRPLVARSRSRNALLSAKWITLILYTILLFLVGFLAVIGFSAVTSALLGTWKGVDASLVGEWLTSFVRLVYSQFPYVALAFFLALITRSNAVGIAVGIGLGFFEQAIWSLLGLTAGVFETIQQFGIDYPSRVLLDINSGDGMHSAMDGWRAAGMLGVWTVLFIGLSYYFFNKRDVTSG